LDLGCEPTNHASLLSQMSQREEVKIAVIGGGSFGTAMATMAARAGHDVHLYVRDQTQAETINLTRKNPKYLSEFTLQESITASNDLLSVLQGALLVILSIPAQTVMLAVFL
jgi:glycerol-3-phosphate dehydrogenase (NAD(P)+)